MRRIRGPSTATKRDDSIPLVITNNCGEDIYPGITTQGGNGPSQTGFKLSSGSSSNLTVSTNWQGRVWGRTNCSFNSDGTGPSNNSPGKACGTGDCNGVLNCQVTGDTPVTLAEFTLNGGDGQTYYDISLVDGYNIPLAIVMNPLSNSKLQSISPNLTNPSCVATAGLLASQDFNPYSSGQQFLGTSSSNPLPFDTQTSDSDVANWCPWDLQVNQPTGPSDGVYQYPDTSVQRPGFDPCYSACAKYNDDADCCTGSHGSPQTCQPNSYSKAAKGVCPDAYSYAFDDQTSTFIIPSGAGFRIIFCPGGRSTNILGAESSQLSQLAGSGSVQSISFLDYPASAPPEPKSSIGLQIERNGMLIAGQAVNTNDNPGFTAAEVGLASVQLPPSILSTSYLVSSLTPSSATTIPIVFVAPPQSSLPSSEGVCTCGGSNFTNNIGTPSWNGGNGDHSGDNNDLDGDGDSTSGQGSNPPDSSGSEIGALNGAPVGSAGATSIVGSESVMVASVTGMESRMGTASESSGTTASSEPVSTSGSASFSGADAVLRRTTTVTVKIPPSFRGRSIVLGFALFATAWLFILL